jgi:hypothetical protein
MGTIGTKCETGAFMMFCSRGKTFGFQREFGSYVMEQVLFRSWLAIHSQTAFECGGASMVEDRLDDVTRAVETQEDEDVRINRARWILRRP